MLRRIFAAILFTLTALIAVVILGTLIPFFMTYMMVRNRNRPKAFDKTIDAVSDILNTQPNPSQARLMKGRSIFKKHRVFKS